MTALDNLRKSAKRWLRALRANDAAARARLRSVHPNAPFIPALRDVQHALARERGFASWTALREQVTGAPPDAEPAIVRDPLTAGEARRMAEQRVTAIKVAPSTPPESLAHLATVTTLRRLDLSGCRQVLDRHLGFLAALPDLQEIDLRNTATGDDVVAALARFPALHALAAGNELTDLGAARLADLPALRQPDRPRAALSVSSSPHLTDRALAAFGDLAGVVDLDLSFWHFGSRTFTERGVAHLRRMSALQKLNFHGALATDAVLREIARIPQLRVLACQDMVAGDEGFAALVECATLEDLWGRWCHGMTDRGFAALARLPRLRKLCIGSRRVSDAAMAALVDAPALRELWPFLFGDSAFPHVARIPGLETLVNMYNRNTTDAATYHLRDHPTLVRYKAFGTQITDGSLRVLAGLPALEELAFENCNGITDAGLRELTRLPRLRRIEVRSCAAVRGSWLAHVPPYVEAAAEPGDPGEPASYQFETLMDYPDVPIPPTAASAPGHMAHAGLVSRLVCLGCRAELGDEGLRLAIDRTLGADRAGALTREAFSVPLRVRVVVMPVAELQVYFGHQRFVVNDGAPEDCPAEVTLDLHDGGGHLSVAGTLHHRWDGDHAGQRSRIGIGPRRSAIVVYDLAVDAP